VETAFEDIKGGIAQVDTPSEVHPNPICDTLDAIEAIIHPRCGRLRRNEPPVGFPSTSPTGGWKSTATAGCSLTRMGCDFSFGLESRWSVAEGVGRGEWRIREVIRQPEKE